MLVSSCECVDISALPTEERRALVHPEAKETGFVSQWMWMLGTEIVSSGRGAKDS